MTGFPGRTQYLVDKALAAATIADASQSNIEILLAIPAPSDRLSRAVNVGGTSAMPGGNRQTEHLADPHVTRSRRAAPSPYLVLDEGEVVSCSGAAIVFLVLLNSVAELDRYRPTNFGRRFSRKAATPSPAS
jgi:hypothetical protein